MRKTKEEAAETRQALLRAALAVFSRQGYAATRLEDVAHEAGVTRGAIYWHFKSKADLYNTLALETAAQGQEIIAQASRGARSFLDATRRFMVRLLQYLEEDATFRAVQALMIFKTRFSPDLQGGMAIKIEGMRAQELALTEQMRQGIAAGEIRADLDPVEGARALIAYLNGVMVTWLLNPQAFSLKASAPGLVDIFLRGIAAQSEL